MQESLEDALAREVESLTQADVDAYLKRRGVEQKAKEKAVADPETLEEFRTFIRSRGIDQLTDEKLARYDCLAADEARERRARERAPDTVEQVQADGLELRISKGFHTKRQCPVWTAILSERVEPETFAELKRKASMLGGWWSSYVKSQAGFQFLSEESASKFASLLEESVSREEELVQRKARRQQTAAENLLELAAGLEDRAGEVLEHDKSKLKNTVRRAEMAATTRAQAYADQALAATMRSIAKALESGEARYLDGVWTKALVEDLLFLLRRSKSDHIQSLVEAARHEGGDLSYREELRAALRELLPHAAMRRGDDPVAKAEQALIGRNLPGLFPTPRPIIRRMLELAGIQPGHTVLEPSAGKGDILDMLQAEFDGQVTVSAIEINRTLQEVLEAKGHDAQFVDFLEHQGRYDRIVMNPPFEAGADMEHVRRAFECLAPGGRLVSVMSEGPFFRSGRQAEAFRAWLDEVGGASEQLPEDAFCGVEAFRETGCRTRIVVIERGNADGPEDHKNL
jgi:hypothetical protein